MVRIARRTLTSVAGGGVCNVDGRDRYRLSGRSLSEAEATERVCYTWASERFLCEGFWGAITSLAECEKQCAGLGLPPPPRGEVADEPAAVQAFIKATLTGPAFKDNS